MEPDLNYIFNYIRTSIEKDDITREKIIKLSRLTIRKCSESIRATHRRELDTSSKLLEEAKSLVNQILEQLPSSGLFENNASIAFQEYIEALELHFFVFKFKNGNILSLEEVNKDLSIPYIAYLHGLCDLVGELRRFVLDSIRLNELQDAERALALMDELFSQLVTLDYPNALVPGIRRKTDLIRSLLEKTRGDITFTHNRLALVEQLKETVPLKKDDVEKLKSLLKENNL